MIDPASEHGPFLVLAAREAGIARSAPIDGLVIAALASGRSMSLDLGVDEAPAPNRGAL